MAGLSTSARSTGIVLMPVILWQMLAHVRQPWPRLVPRMALCALLAVSGLLAYMAYLGIVFGHPLAFATGQVAWHHGTFLERFVSGLTLEPFRRAELSTSAWFLGFLALTLWSFRRLPSAWALYGLGALLLPYLTLGFTDSLLRFLLMCFPAFISLALLCRGRPWLAGIIIGIFGALLLRDCALISAWHFIG